MVTFGSSLLVTLRTAGISLFALSVSWWFMVVPPGSTAFFLHLIMLYQHLLPYQLFPLTSCLLLPASFLQSLPRENNEIPLCSSHSLLLPLPYSRPSGQGADVESSSLGTPGSWASWRSYETKKGLSFYLRTKPAFLTAAGDNSKAVLMWFPPGSTWN